MELEGKKASVIGATSGIGREAARRLAALGAETVLSGHFEGGVADLDADVESTLASVYRPGSPDGVGTIAPTATVTGLPAGHWLPVEQKEGLTEAIHGWLRSRIR